MKTLISLVCSLVMLGAVSTSHAAGDAAAGKAKAIICAACHGANGISAVDIWPNLAGQKEGYLVKQIKAFRDGVRVDATMQPMVKSLTDEDIANLAAHFSSL